MDDQQPGTVSWGFSNPNAKPLPPKLTQKRTRPATKKDESGVGISKVRTSAEDPINDSKATWYTTKMTTPKEQKKQKKSVLDRALDCFLCRR